ncbi:MAG: DUF1080 domain-containing protein, partial [Verrucomicrobia bacterium]|nr:DUF1080 domain-containing protein [Verrucomicrobiota bacterium]
GWFGKLYDEFRRNKVIWSPTPEQQAALDKAIDTFGWNEYRIRAEGARIQVWINSVLCVDYTETDPNIALDGLLGPQVHAGGICLVQMKDVFIEELPPTKDAPTWESIGGVDGQKKMKAVKPNRAAAMNVADAQPKSPEEELKTFTLPEGFEIELVVAESDGIGKFVTVDWDQKGRLWTQTALEYPVDGNENMERAQALYASQGKDKVLIFDDTTGAAPHKFHVFTDGLAIPLGMMPYKNGVYVQHGPNIEFREDTNGDGKADKTTVTLSGFGVQDSHLFMHEFRRMPGDWIWGAQGAFNKGTVKSSTGVETDFPSTRMARFRPDGSKFEILCTGPCNIWGFEVNGEGEMFIQEANDYGYPVMPFHIGANYPGCADRLFKSYAPEFPGLATFRMGGTGLSGLALANRGSKFESGPHSPSAASPEPHAENADHMTIYVANPITRMIQAIKIKRDGPRYALEKLPDFIESTDPMFRPVSIHFGPDGALYIVDWYNKIISHNEVPRNHPDRDKTRGRIWRVKEKFEVRPSGRDRKDERPEGRTTNVMPDFTKCAPEELIAKLGDNNIKQSHLAWQAIIDRKLVDLAPKLKAIISDGKTKTATRIEALWALEGLSVVSFDSAFYDQLTHDSDRNIRREITALLGRFYQRGDIRPGSVHLEDTLHFFVSPSHDPDPEVRQEAIRAVGPFVHKDPRLMKLIVGMALPSLDAPVGPSTRNGKPMKIAEAYEREFERYLIRQSLEQHPEAVEAFLKTTDAEKLPLESRLLATLSLPAKTSAPLVAKLLGELKRPPNDEEILRLAEGLGDPAVNASLSAALKNDGSRENIAAALLRLRTKLDANKLTPLLLTTAKELLDGNAASQNLALQLTGEFQFTELEAPIVALLKSWLGDHANTPRVNAALRALGLMGSRQSELFAKLATSDKDPLVRNEALNALVSSKADDAGARVLALWKDLDSAGRRLAMDRLCTTKPGAHAVVAALKAKTLKADDMDASAIDRLQTVLGPNDAELSGVMSDLSALFRPVLRLDGSKEDYVDTGVTLDGPFTVETWVKLDGPKIENTDGILGSPGQLDMNFYGSQFRIFSGAAIQDALVAKKKMAPDNWTHIAVTRDEKGFFQIFMDGELDQSGGKPAPHKMENVRIGWAGSRGARGMFSEFRIWNRVRTPQEIRDNFDRSMSSASLAYHGSGEKWPKLHGKAHIVKTSNLPPLLTPEEAKSLDAKFAKYRGLAQKPGGDPTKGKLAAGICLGCHLIQGQGGNLAPNISGAGTMGLEAILRNIITPNAAMEAGYRIFRVELKTGDIVDSFFVNEDKDAFVVRQPGLPDKRISKNDVRSTKYIRRSLMPEGILDALPPEMVTDLFSYLMSLKG